MRTINKILTVLLLVAFFSCEDILEDDISNDIIQIVYPQNNQEVYSNVVNFQWNELDGADKYRIQVFSNNSGIVLDSLITQNSLSFPLTQGNYEWRVRGENSAYTSSYSLSYDFSVFESDDLTNQQVILTSPTDVFYTNNTSLILTWQSLLAAESYSFELVNLTSGSTIVNQQNGLISTSVTLNSGILNQNAEYNWKVKAVNSLSQTPFTSRIFSLDTVLPNQPINILPANNSIKAISQVISFSWNIPSDSGVIQSPITYKIEFSNDVSFASLIQSTDVTTNSFSQSFSTASNYYWRVLARDLAGNVGIVSSSFMFTIE